MSNERIPLAVVDDACSTCILRNTCERESAPNRFMYNFIISNEEAFKRIKEDKLTIIIRCRNYSNDPDVVSCKSVDL